MTTDEVYTCPECRYALTMSLLPDEVFPAEPVGACPNDGHRLQRMREDGGDRP